MKTPKRNRDEVRANTLVIPMRKDEKERIIKAADAMGVSMSAYVRIVLNEHFKKN